jgi:hypothetical protein
MEQRERLTQLSSGGLRCRVPQQLELDFNFRLDVLHVWLDDQQSQLR